MDKYIKFELHWRRGGTEIVEGRDISHAITRAGHNRGDVFKDIYFWRKLTAKNKRPPDKWEQAERGDVG